MKIFAISDLHGKANIKFPKEVDLILVAGDVTPYLKDKTKAREEAKKVIEALAKIKKKIVLVSGNIDFPKYTALLCKKENIKYLKHDSFEFNDVVIIGFSYGLSYEKIIKKGSELFEKYKDKKIILLTHEPPFNTKVDLAFNGNHVGNLAYRELIEKFQPQLHICGHIHEARGIDNIKNTKIVNCGTKGALIKINKKIRLSLI